MIHIRPVGDSFAARVSGVDISRGVTETERDLIAGAISQYPVLCFSNQILDDEQQSSFSRRFGTNFEIPASVVSRPLETTTELVDVANVELDLSPINKESAKARFYDANLLWHTDGSYTDPPILYSLLSARLLPSVPPDTEYADMRAAWDALSSGMKAKCEDLVVAHNLIYSRRRMGMSKDEFTPQMLAAFGRSVHHPLVRTHAASGRRSLYLSSHAGKIAGWDDDASEAFLNELTQHATRPEFVYAHKWQAHDLMMWDDSCTMHRATIYDGDEPRLLRWGSVLEHEDLR